MNNLNTAPGSATERQADYVSDLIDSRDLFKSPRHFDAVNAMDANEYAAYLTEMKRVAREQLSMSDASAWIDALKSLPKKQDEQTQPQIVQENGEPEAGMYRTSDDTILRIYLGQKSGRMLVKRVIEVGDGYDYDYIGAAAGKARGLMRDATPMSLDEAKAWGRMTGHCCVCARRLDVPESVEAGIGPVCSGRVGEVR